MTHYATWPDGNSTIHYCEQGGDHDVDRHGKPVRSGDTTEATVYRPFDQAERLGDRPYGGDDLLKWEAVHGHDVRLKCYPEYGCMVIEQAAREEGRAEERERIAKAIDAAAREAKRLAEAERPVDMRHCMYYRHEAQMAEHCARLARNGGAS